MIFVLNWRSFKNDTMGRIILILNSFGFSLICWLYLMFDDIVELWSGSMELHTSDQRYSFEGFGNKSWFSWSEERRNWCNNRFKWMEYLKIIQQRTWFLKTYQKNLKEWNFTRIMFINDIDVSSTINQAVVT